MAELFSKDKIEQICQSYQVEPLLAKVILQRNISLQQFKQFQQIPPLPSPFTFTNMDKAIELIRNSLANFEKIMVYGDYDADGIISTSIIVKMLEDSGGIVGFYIPSREVDGYGLTITRAREILQKGYKLVILVDNGIACNEAVDILKEGGVKVIIADHHLSKHTLPNADVILQQFICNFTTYNISAGTIAFHISRAFLGKDDPYFLTLAAISTISDIMPLVEDNRTLLMMASELYQQTQFLQIDLLRDNQPFCAEKIASPIASMINATGRVVNDGSINNLVKFFTSSNPKVISSIYTFMKKNNEIRKEMVTDALQKLSSYQLSSSPIELLSLDFISSGISGLLANHLLGKWKKPVIILTIDPSNPGIYVGSARSNGSVDLALLLSEAKQFLLEYGGHKEAAGLRLEKEQVEQFRNYLMECKLTPISPPEVIAIDIEDLTPQALEQLLILSPFGEHNPAPIFSLSSLSFELFNHSKDGAHLLGKLGIFSLLAFSFGHLNLNKNDKVNITFTCFVSYYYGRKKYELHINHIEEEIKENV